MGEGNHQEFSLEDILEEQRRQRAKQSVEEPPEELPQEAPPEAEQEPAQQRQDQNPQHGGTEPAEEAEDLNAFATGRVSVPGVSQEMQEPAGEGDGKKKKKKKKGGLFGRKKRAPDFDEGEDMYYGIQLKPLDEYRKGFDPVTGEFTLGEDSFKALFDDSKQAIDDEVEANFQKLQKERRRRVAEAVQIGRAHV